MSDELFLPPNPSNGTFCCPICGQDSPHWHSEQEIAAHRANQAKRASEPESIFGNPLVFAWRLALVLIASWFIASTIGWAIGLVIADVIPVDSEQERDQ